MRQRIIMTVCLIFLLTSVAPAQEKTLYDRLGGLDAIKAVVDDFVGRVAADARINKKFARSNVERVKIKIAEQICAATKGPCKYTGLDMKKSHKNMKVTEGEFNALVEDLVAALDKFKVPEKEKNELLGILGPLKPQIVEVSGTATGTELPKNFKPAPALKKNEVTMTKGAGK
jgi:hemoglobin